MDAKSDEQEQIRRPFRDIRHSLAALLLLNFEQVMASHEDVRQGCHHEQSVTVVPEPTVADLGKSEDALDDQKGVFDRGSNPQLGSILLPVPVGERIVSAALLVARSFTPYSEFL